MKEISIIIPFKGTTETLPRLFDSIPKQDNIEIILVENSDTPLSRAQIGIDRDYILLNATECRYAGGARNVGIEASSGQWLIFADADDFFSKYAFDVFFQYIDSDYDIIYFGCDSVFGDTLEQSDRHIPFNNIVQNLHKKAIEPIKGKLYHVVPWAKMIRAEFIEKYHIRFDEVIASNDIFFSTLCAYYSVKFKADPSKLYIVTTTKGSLANRWNKEILRARYSVALKRNKFLRNNNLGIYQVSVMYYLYQGFKIRPSMVLSLLYEAFKSKQNIFIGIGGWLKTFWETSKDAKSKKKYIDYN